MMEPSRPSGTKPPPNSHEGSETAKSRRASCGPAGGSDPPFDGSGEEDFDFERELLRSFEKQAQQPDDDPPARKKEGLPGVEKSGARGKKGPKKQEAEPFNSPFQGLEKIVDTGSSARAHAPGPQPTGVPTPEDPREETRPAKRREGGTGASDEEEFWRAMSGVEPLPDKNEIPARRVPAVSSVSNEEAEALARLSDLVTGSVDFDISDTIEYVEGIAKGLDRRLLTRLRKGQYSVQAHLDLHGMTREEAKAAVFEFLVDARRRSLRCLLVITGRGRHSQGKQPVLKTALTEWLTGKKLGRHVLAFCSARPHDGGAGALYVLLRR